MESHKSPPFLDPHMLDSQVEDRHILSNELEARKSRKKIFTDRSDQIFNIGADGQTQTSPLKQTSDFEKPDSLSKDLFNSKNLPEIKVSEFSTQKVSKFT